MGDDLVLGFEVDVDRIEEGDWLSLGDYIPKQPEWKVKVRGLTSKAVQRAIDRHLTRAGRRRKVGDITRLALGEAGIVEWTGLRNLANGEEVKHTRDLAVSIMTNSAYSPAAVAIVNFSSELSDLRPEDEEEEREAIAGN